MICIRYVTFDDCLQKVARHFQFSTAWLSMDSTWVQLIFSRGWVLWYFYDLFSNSCLVFNLTEKYNDEKYALWLFLVSSWNAPIETNQFGGRNCALCCSFIHDIDIYFEKFKSKLICEFVSLVNHWNILHV